MVLIGNLKFFDDEYFNTLTVDELRVVDEYINYQIEQLQAERTQLNRLQSKIRMRANEIEEDDPS